VPGKSYAKEFRESTLAENSVGRIISGISEELCDQLTDKYILHCKWMT
jgi:hypothetical protein